MTSKIFLKNQSHSFNTYRGGKHGPTEPHGVALHRMANNIDINSRWRGSSQGPRPQSANVCVHTHVYKLFDVALQSSSEILEHSGTAREYDVLI
jgi:hypothetical protein